MIHINTRSSFSFLRAYGTPKQIVKRASELGLKCLGIADYCSTWGHIQFQKECLKADILPVLGITLPVVLQLDKDPRHDLVTLVAITQDGLQEIYKAMGRAKSQMFYRPRLTWNQVRELKSRGVGVIVEHVRIETRDIPAAQGYPVALRPHPGHMIGMIKSGDCTPIAALGASFPRIEHREGYDMVRATSNMQRIGDIDLPVHHMMSEKEYRHALTQFRISDDIVGRAIAVSEGYIAAGAATIRVPRAQNITFEGAFETLRQKCVDAFWSGYRPQCDTTVGPYADRLIAELEVIKAKNFADYFLFVGELVWWAKQRMFVGPGRGSSGGSLVCYLLGITEVDPIVHGTLFERFIDITRNDWPDIDVDFPDRSRGDVLTHLIQMYGAARVAKIGTVAELAGKSALNDTARALKVPFETSRLVARLMGEDMTLEEAFEDKAIAMVVEQFPNFKKAALLEGQPRHHGVHAAGIIVTADDITRYASVDEESVAALTLKDAEEIGALKMDALGLRTLSVIEDCCKEAGLDVNKLYSLPLDNDETFDMFRRDLLTGVFQFEGSTVRGLTRQISVDRFSDLCALTSLARPGPLEGGAAGNWVKRRSGKEEMSFEHPLLEPYLGDTYGTVIYQEQMMNIVRYIADFSIEDTNKFRRAIGKKLPEELKKFEDQFLKNAGVKVGEKIAKSLWHQMEESGSYAFNFSHAVAYSMVSYITAYLKAHYPLEYGLAQLLNARDEEASKALLQELERDDVTIVAFDPERSGVNWRIENGALIGGFLNVKGIGLKTAEKIVALRDEVGHSWRAKVGAGVLKKIEDPANWAWADVGRLQRKLRVLYDNPDQFITKSTTAGVSGPASRICEIPTGKGSYLICGVLVKKTLRDSNDPERVAKRGGSKNAGPQHFLNLILSDGTGEIGCTINRFKYASDGATIWHDQNAEGKLFLVRGTCISDGSRWLMCDKIVDVSDFIEEKENDEPIADADHAGEDGSIGAGCAGGAGECAPKDDG